MNMMDRLGFEEDQPIESRMITKAIEQAQKRVEGNNFDIRKTVLQYDDVMNQQRKIVYQQRREVLEAESIRDIVIDMIKSVAERVIEAHCTDDLVPEEWDLQAVIDYFNGTFLTEGQLTVDDLKGKEKEEIIEQVNALIERLYEERENEIGETTMREFEKVVVLRAVDSKWMDHIDAMDQLRPASTCRHTEAPIRCTNTSLKDRDVPADGGAHPGKNGEVSHEGDVESNLQRQKVAEGENGHIERRRIRPFTPPGEKENQKIGRNEPCPCGSGKKYKHCWAKRIKCTS